MKLHFHKLGQGPNVLIAFHGIGQDGFTCFETFEKELGHYYSIYAFDLFFHGSSDANYPALISKAYWKVQVQDFLHQNAIDRFDLAGFSMGGRFALATLESFPENVNNVILMAPDGISEHPLYTLASRFPPTRKLFEVLMKNPVLLIRTAHFLQKTGLIHSSLYRFTKHILNTPERRKSIYQSWVAFRKLHFDIQLLYKETIKNNIKIYLFVGKYDKLLKEADVNELAHLLPEKQYIMLPAGHTQLVEKVAIYWSAWLENGSNKV